MIDRFLCLLLNQLLLLSIVKWALKIDIPRPKSDYALKNEIERLKFDQSEQKEPKFLYLRWKFQSLIFNLNLQCII